MSYCSNCGTKLQDGVRFCSNCGNENTAQNQSMHYTQQSSRSFYDGKVHKCPNCGEILNSFVPYCPSCGCEIRGTSNKNSISYFAQELKQYESQGMAGQNISNFIMNYPIPNTQEDILEFLILAVSSIDPMAYGKMKNGYSAAEKERKLLISTAWNMKYDQALQKAKIMFPNDSRLLNAESLFKTKQRQIRKQKTKVLRITLSVIGGIIAFYAVLFAVIFGIVFAGVNAEEKKAKKEDDRLNQIEVSIQIDIENGDYDSALIKANSLRFDSSLSSTKAEEWDKRREELIDMSKDIKEKEER